MKVIVILEDQENGNLSVKFQFPDGVDKDTPITPAIEALGVITEALKQHGTPVGKPEVTIE